MNIETTFLVEQFVTVRAGYLFLSLFPAGISTLTIRMGLVVSGQALLRLVRTVAVLAAKRPQILMNMPDMNPQVSHFYKCHRTVFTLVLFLCEMPRDVTVQILLRHEGGSTRNAFKVFRDIHVGYSVVIQGLFPSKRLGTDVTQIRFFTCVLPFVNLKIRLI